MNQESLAECIYEQKWYNPFPKFKFTERPDTASAAILEGNIVILVDNSPQAMIVPTSIFDIVEEADDYYFPPVTGSYLRLSQVSDCHHHPASDAYLFTAVPEPGVDPPVAGIHCDQDTVHVPVVLAVPDAGAGHRRPAGWPPSIPPVCSVPL